MAAQQPGGAENRELAEQVKQRLADEAGIYAAVRVVGDTAYLDGLVESLEQRNAATDLAQAMVGIKRVQNDLDVEDLEAGSGYDVNDSAQIADLTYQMLQGDLPLSADALDPDFNDAAPHVGADMTSDSMVATEAGLPYSPPTDPVVRPAENNQGLEIVGGFGAAADDAFPDDPVGTALGAAPPGDEDLEEQVLAELAADAMTTDLAIEVAARNGVVRLRGRVPTLDDAEAAEAVAGNVPGVREVIEELEVAALED